MRKVKLEATLLIDPHNDEDAVEDDLTKLLDLHGYKVKTMEVESYDLKVSASKKLVWTCHGCDQHNIIDDFEVKSGVKLGCETCGEEHDVEII